MALLLLWGLARLLPVPWFQDAAPSGDPSPPVSRRDPADMEGITLLILPATDASPSPPAWAPDRIERGVESSPEPATPTGHRALWNWSYDPLVPLQAGRPEPVLHGARLPDLAAGSRSEWLEAPSANDSLRLRLEHYAFLQGSYALAQRHLWDAEARALWLERHELWLKLYGSDDDWP